MIGPVLGPVACDSHGSDRTVVLPPARSARIPPAGRCLVSLCCHKAGSRREFLERLSRHGENAGKARPRDPGRIALALGVRAR